MRDNRIKRWFAVCIVCGIAVVVGGGADTSPAWAQNYPLLEEINRQGTTIIMVTHDPELAARAQRNVHIVDGMATDLSVEPALIRAAHAAEANASA